MHVPNLRIVSAILVLGVSLVGGCGRAEGPGGEKEPAPSAESAPPQPAASEKAQTAPVEAEAAPVVAAAAPEAAPKVPAPAEAVAKPEKASSARPEVGREVSNAEAAVISARAAEPSEAQPEDPIQAMSASVLNVYTGKSRGTGFAIRGPSDRVFLVTAAHVVYDGTDISVMQEFIDSEDRSQVFRVAYPEVEVVAVDFETDLAVLEVINLPEGRLKPLELDLAAESCSRAHTTWGYPDTIFGSGKLALTRTVLASATPQTLDVLERFAQSVRVLKKGAVKGLVFSPEVESGTSGGPITDRDGKVVAVVVMKSQLQSQGAAVCSSYLSELVRSAASTAPPTKEEIAGHLRHFSLNILPYARSADERPPIREWVSPQAIAQLGGFFNDFLLLSFTAAGAEEGGGQELLERTQELFPSLKELAGVEACLTNDSIDLNCVSMTAVPGLAVDAFELSAGVKPGATDLSVNSDPEEVDPKEHVYQVNISYRDREGESKFRKLKFRRSFGRIWIELPSLTSLILKGDPNFAEFAEGEWEVEETGKDKASNGYHTKYKNNVAVVITREGESLSGTVTVAHKETFLSDEAWWNCNDEQSYRATGSFKFQGKVSRGHLTANATAVTRKGCYLWKKTQPVKILLRKVGNKLKLRYTRDNGKSREFELNRKEPGAAEKTREKKKKKRRKKAKKKGKTQDYCTQHPEDCW